MFSFPTSIKSLKTTNERLHRCKAPVALQGSRVAQSPRLGPDYTTFFLIIVIPVGA